MQDESSVPPEQVQFVGNKVAKLIYVIIHCIMSQSRPGGIISHTGGYLTVASRILMGIHMDINWYSQ